MLKFLSRTFNDFTSSAALRAVYCPILRTQLYYCTTVVRAQCIQGDRNILEGLQNRFLRFYCFKRKIDRMPFYLYNHILELLSLDSI